MLLHMLIWGIIIGFVLALLSCYIPKVMIGAAIVLIMAWVIKRDKMGEFAIDRCYNLLSLSANLFK